MRSGQKRPQDGVCEGPALNATSKPFLLDVPGLPLNIGTFTRRWFGSLSLSLHPVNQPVVLTLFKTAYSRFLHTRGRQASQPYVYSAELVGLLWSRTA